MVKIVEMDENVKLKSQLDEDVGPVILLNKFTVQPEDVDQFLKAFAEITKISCSNLALSLPNCIVVLVVAAHFLIMVFGSLQNTSNEPSIDQSYGQALLTFFPIQQCLHIYSRR